MKCSDFSYWEKELENFTNLVQNMVFSTVFIATNLFFPKHVVSVYSDWDSS